VRCGTDGGCASWRRAKAGVIVNDIQSKLNPTWVDHVVAVDSEAALRAARAAARAEGKPVGVAGGRHAMGGHPFLTDGVLLDTRPMQRSFGLDAERGIVEAEAGIQWPDLIRGLIAMQQGRAKSWSIVQNWNIVHKQTGADRLCSAARSRPKSTAAAYAQADVDNIVSFTRMDGDGRCR
jgi:hypothetical protein